ncbi:MAG: hypothetical protein IJW75_04530 [Alphaproteobacteria bacterium]|nr:hypothetical protein [Alphaproteobacteria bacterium]
MGFIICAGIFVLVWCFPSVVFCVISHIGSSIKYGLTDFIDYYRFKRYRNVKMGEIIAFTGLFGMGKTLSAVHRICTIYRANNGVRVYCPRRKKWVTQRVRILSNVEFIGIPFIPLNSLQDITDSTDAIRVYDDEHDTLTLTFVLIDEAGSVLNSREFKKNIDALALNSILTCRHWNISIFYTAQRFMNVDALLRQVTSYVYECKKVWRLQFQRKYDAWTLEQAQNPGKVPCEAILSWFVRNIDYNSYDTYACVDDLKKSVESGKMQSEDEILSKLNLQPANLDVAQKKKKVKPRYLF